MHKSRTSAIIDMAHGRLTPGESLRLFDEIENDPTASAELDLVADLMNVAAETNGNVFRERDRARAPLWKRLAWRIREKCDERPVLYPVGSLAVAMLALAMILGANALWSNKYEELLGIDRTAFEWSVRGEGDEDVSTAYHYFTNGEYTQALESLQRYLRIHPDGELTAYVHYSTGSICLLSAKRNVLSLFTKYDPESVNTGLDHLGKATAQSNNPRLVEESLFLRAKGFLMLGREEDAIAELRRLHTLKGPKTNEARQVIERINALNGKIK